VGWLLGLVVLYHVIALLLYKRIEPVVFGVLFFMFWMLFAAACAPQSI
jgi:hypothetical protein